LGGREPDLPRTAGRGRDGYTLGQRFWASFIGLDLRIDRFATVPPTVPPGRARKVQFGPSTRVDSWGRSRSIHREPGWFPLPRLVGIGGLTAAGDDVVVLEASSPDGRVRFLVRTDRAVQPEYRLELVLDGIDATWPVVCAVRYTDAGGGEQVLLVPVLQ